MQVTKNATGRGSAPPRGMRVSLLCLAVVVALLCLFGEGVSAGELPEKKRILVLYPRWGMGRMEALFNNGLHAGVQDDSDLVVGITQEGLGLEYVASNDDLQNIIDHLRQKSEANPIDLVIAFLPTANEFLSSHGETLFPGIPKVFMAPYSRSVKRLQGIPETVVIESVTQAVLSTNVARIFSLLPDTKHLVVVSGSGALDQAYLPLAQEAITSHEAAGQAQVSYLVGLPLEELLERVAKLEEHTAVLFLTYEQDTAKQVYRTIEVVSLVCEQSNAPVFGMVGTHFGKGIVGGKLVSIEAYGKNSAEVAMKLLHGEPPKSIVPVEVGTVDWYDWGQLERWGIPESRLPPESQIINKPPSLWEAHRTVAIVAMVSITVLSLFIIALVVNLIRRRKTEVALRESHAENKKAQEIAHLGNWKLNFETNELSWSDEIYRIFGLEPREFDETYEAFLERVHPEERDSVNKAYSHSVERGEPYQITHRVLRPDGKIRIVREQCDHIKDNKGKIICSIGTVLDITELNKTEEKLQESEQKFRSLVEHSGVGIAVYQDNQRVFYNTRMHEMLGYTEAEYKNVAYLSEIHPDDRSFAADRIQRRLAGTETNPGSAEIRMLTKSGEIRWIETDSVRTKWNERPALQIFVLDITERKQADEVLRESEATARALLNAPTDLILLLDTSGVMLAVNETAVRLYDKTEDELIGLCIWDIFPPDVVKYRKPYNEIVIQSGKPVRFEDEREGTWFDNVLYPIFDDQHRVTKIAVIARDITKRKKAEETIRERQEFINALVETSQEWIWSIDLKGNHTYCNPAVKSILGYFPGDMVGQNSLNLMHDEDRQIIEQKLPEWIEKKCGWNNLIIRWRHKDGSWRYLESNSVPILDSHNNLIGFRGVDRDITERKQAEEILKENEAKLRAIFDQTFQLMGLLSKEGTLLKANQTALEFAGVDEAEVIGKPFWETAWWTHSEEEQEKVKKAIEKATSGEFVRFESTHSHCSGTIHTLDVSLKPILDDAGRVIFLNPEARDITDRKRAEEELRKAFTEISGLKEQLEFENIELRKEIQKSHLHGGIVSESEAMKTVMLQAERVAKTDSSVLLLGETGTGKEILGRAIHEMSTRSNGPLIVVNCAAVPSGLIESELFGHEKGAFTGANSRQIGRFEAAKSGTIFLDEIGELPSDVQVKLLRVLQERKIERLGSNKSIGIDVRIIAATNRDLEQAIKEEKFREDLYFRLNVYPITIPPLRERPEDIKELVQLFVQEFSGSMGKPVKKVTQVSMDRLRNYSLPGNVRELRNLVERAMIQTTSEVLKIEIPETKHESASGVLSLEEAERDHILKILALTKWRVRGSGGAAELLQINPSTLDSRIKKLKIVRPKD
jgi:PAS domain S-box-containing protein